MCEQARAQYVRLNDTLTRRLEELRALEDEEPPGSEHGGEVSQQTLRIWESRKVSLRCDVEDYRAMLALARTGFIIAGGDASTLPGPGESE